jgi:tetratricopeptide (TPR) repeat protein
MPDDRLDGWKAIGNFLGRDRTTALRWSKQRGLPVHRVPGGRTGTVYALRSELSEWLSKGAETSQNMSTVSKASPRAQWRPTAMLVGGAVVVAAIAGITTWRANAKGDSAIALTVVTAPGGDRITQQFTQALTADLARFANASAGLAVYEQEGTANRTPDYALRTKVESGPQGLSINAWIAAGRDGAIVWSRRTDQASAGEAALRERVAANIVGVLRCSFGTLDGEHSGIKTPELASLLAACQSVMDDDLDQALVRARALTESRPDLAASWAVLAQIAATRAEDGTKPALWSEARSAAARAAKISPDSPCALMAQALTAQDTLNALQVADRALAKYPDNPDFLRLYSGLLFNTGYVHASVDPALQAMRSDPTWLHGRDFAVRRLAADGRFEDAERLQRENERIWPGHPVMVMQRERTAFDRGVATPAQLRIRLVDSMRAYPDEPTAAYTIARLFERLGNRAAALKWLERAPTTGTLQQQSVLFWPDMNGLRTDPAFFGKLAALGLVRLWVARKQWPDFCGEPGLKYSCATEAAKLGIK